ncbi:5-formyltetrahydrofolate cyclo-ligase [Bombyx mandarina]|uniref:5-formyltetrahydrofolate cyclo-ligase n=1 Tax=Bombyx mandarina TaxID=7092 RepID=A0A6J2J7K5_BOMMA|nr:5-formyltetrahydrofolate cyclo-ligase [Bombyx mandarina]XP_028025218.1 5-formyltetrahydrofolate cyclo-ligase [Bombyx mandarina]
MSPIKPNPAKALLRNEIAAKIAALTNEEKKRQSQIVYEKVINHSWYKSSSRIALYMSTENEIDTAPLIKHIQARGAAAFVPQYAGGRMRMLHLETGDEQTMPKTKHGISQHGKDQSRDDALGTGGLDLIIAPGVAFSRSGDRLGHGGGYYDKFITNLRLNPETAPKIVAVAFNCQVVDMVPTNEQDQKVNEVIFAE